MTSVTSSLTELVQATIPTLFENPSTFIPSICIIPPKKSQRIQRPLSSTSFRSLARTHPTQRINMVAPAGSFFQEAALPEQRLVEGVAFPAVLAPSDDATAAGGGLDAFLDAVRSERASTVERCCGRRRGAAPRVPGARRGGLRPRRGRLRVPGAPLRRRRRPAEQRGGACLHRQRVAARPEDPLPPRDGAGPPYNHSKSNSIRVQENAFATSLY